MLDNNKNGHNYGSHNGSISLTSNNSVMSMPVSHKDDHGHGSLFISHTAHK